MLTWQSGQYSPTGAPEQVLDVTRAAQLRRAVLAARHDPRIRDHRYWLHPSGPRRLSMLSAAHGSFED
jgi:hypothetical protein